MLTPVVSPVLSFMDVKVIGCVLVPTAWSVPNTQILAGRLSHHVLLGPPPKLLITAPGSIVRVWPPKTKTPLDVNHGMGSAGNVVVFRLPPERSSTGSPFPLASTPEMLLNGPCELTS